VVRDPFQFTIHIKVFLFEIIMHFSHYVFRNVSFFFLSIVILVAMNGWGRLWPSLVEK